MNLADRLEHCYTGAVYDVLRSLGHPRQALPSTIRPLDPGRKLTGRVFTASGGLADIGAHESLLEWTALLSSTPADSVLICQPHDSTIAHMGELSSETLQFRKVRGYIVDGGCRDSDFILKIGFPVFCRYFTPVDIVGRWKAEKLGEPIQIGDVTIATGDYVMADRDGVVIIPAALAAEVVEKTEQVMGTENLVRTAILRGVDPREAYLKYGKF